MVDLLEVRVGKADENLVQLNESDSITYRMLSKVIMECLHGVRANDSHVVAVLVLTVDS